MNRSSAQKTEQKFEITSGSLAKTRPMAFLEKLKQSAKAAAKNRQFSFIIHGSTPANWITETDVYELGKQLNSRTPALTATSALSSYAPETMSTEGQEAAFLIRGFIEKKYPPSICSTYGLTDNVQLARKWLKDHPKK